MDYENFYNASCSGTKSFTQLDVSAANDSSFGAAAHDYMQSGIDLNEQLISNKPATILMRVNSDAMSGAGIYSCDTVIIDRSVKAVSSKVVIAILNSEMLIRRYERSFNKIRLLPDSEKLSPISVDASYEDFSIWGVVTYVIHPL